jgi:hypothetical protein
MTISMRCPTEGLSPEQAASAYETTLKRFYGADTLAPDRPLFDVTLLGIGEDGHTASLFPGQPALQETRRWAVAVIGAKAEARITLTYPALDSSRDVAFLVTGQEKRGSSRAPRPEIGRFPQPWFARSGVSTGSRIAPRRQQERLMSVQTPTTEDTHRLLPAVVIVMGVSGCGKSTIGALLAHRACDGNSRTPIGSTRLPTSTRCTAVFRSPTRIAGRGWTRSPPGSTRRVVRADMTSSHAPR